MTYRLGRGLVIFLGILIALASLNSYLLMPGLYYDGSEGPPGYPVRLFHAGLGVAVGLLYAFPNRLTVGPTLYWPRIALLASVSLFLLAITARDLYEYPRIALLRSAISLPLALLAIWCLWYRRHAAKSFAATGRSSEGAQSHSPGHRPGSSAQP